MSDNYFNAIDAGLASDNNANVNAAALQRLTDSVQAAGGVTITIPPGIYAINGTIRSIHRSARLLTFAAARARRSFKRQAPRSHCSASVPRTMSAATSSSQIFRSEAKGHLRNVKLLRAPEPKHKNK
jgi:hypothetical protein